MKLLQSCEATKYMASIIQYPDEGGKGSDTLQNYRYNSATVEIAWEWVLAPLVASTEVAHWGSKDKAVQRRRDRRATINREQGRGGQKDRGGEGGKEEESEDMKRGEKGIQF